MDILLPYQAWLEAIKYVLGEYNIVYRHARQLAGIVAMIFSHRNLENVESEIDTDAVTLGAMGRTFANKGAVAFRLIHTSYLFWALSALN